MPLAPIFPDHYFTKCHLALARIAEISPLTEAEIEFCRNQIKKTRKNSIRLSKTWQLAENTSHRRFLESVLTQSFSNHLTAAIFEYVFARSADKPLKPLSWDELEARAFSAQLASDHPDAANLHVIKKASGKPRVTVSPGPNVRTAQRAYGNVLDCRPRSTTLDFNSRGMGRDAALMAVSQLILEQKIEHFAIIDIENFYSSVRPAHLDHLSLPTKVQETAFFNLRCSIKDMKGDHKNVTTKMIQTKAARCGLPTGASNSGKLAGMLLGRIFDTLTDAAGIVLYADDVIIGARSESDAHEIVDALRNRLANLNGGPLGLKHTKVVTAREGGDFLGYWFALRGEPEAAEVIFWPSHPAKKKFETKIRDKLRAIGKDSPFDEARELFRTYRKSWIKSFPLWRPRYSELKELFDQSDSWFTHYYQSPHLKISYKPVFSDL